MLTLLLDEDVPPEMNINQSKGINLSMLMLHLFTSLSECTPEQDLYPLKEIITDPAKAAVGYYCIFFRISKIFMAVVILRSLPPEYLVLC